MKTVLLFLLSVTALASEVVTENPGSPNKTVNITVVDEQGKPVSGANVRPFYLRLKEDPGSSYGWNGSAGGGAPTTAHTDAAGNAPVLYPETLGPGLHTKMLAVFVDHPAFCSKIVEIDVDAPEAISLQRGMRLTVASNPLSGATASPLYVDAKAASYEYQNLTWQRSDQGSLSTSLPKSDFAVRAIVFDQDGGVYFSPPVIVPSSGEGEKTLNLDVVPGTTIRGQLDSSVPRPVKNGRVVAEVFTPVAPSTDLTCEWAVSSDIAADGTFILPPLPSGSLELVAVCDGFVSSDPKGARGVSRNAQVFAVDKSAQLTVRMEKTGSAEILVSDPSGNPLPNAQVSFWPNQVFGNGSSLLGRPFDSADFLRRRQDSPDADFKQLPDEVSGRFSGKTDSGGRTVISNLPSGTQSFAVTAAKFEQPILEKADHFPRRQGEVQIKPGEESRTAVKMENKGASSLPDAIKRFKGRISDAACQADPSTQTGTPLQVTAGKDFIGKVVDESGAPLEGVKVDAWTWYPRNETLTDKNGDFKLEKPTPGTQIEVRFNKDGFSPIHITTQEVGALAAPLVLNSKTFFEGIVNDTNGLPVSDAKISARCGPKQSPGCVITSLAYDATTGKDGRYRLYAPPDTYDVQVRALGNLVARLPNTILSQDQGKILNISVSEGMTFLAHLTDSITGQPVKGVRVYNGFDKEIEGVSDEMGMIKIPGMLAGSCEFEVDAAAIGYRRWWSQQSKNEWQRFKIEPGGWQRNFDSLSFDVAPRMGQVEIALEKGVSILGEIVAPDGSPVADATAAPA
ncbi:MAG: carboxypeptidase-like regulatory domain-containing protein, partial [Terrimicrobiaceae bacterium]